MRFLVTGGNGQLGLELQKQLQRGGHQFVGTDHKEMDITDYGVCEQVISKWQPNVVVNCAAHTKVDLCETDVDSAYRINGLGPRNLAVLSNKYGYKMVQISTDYVFSGEEERPRREDDRIGPVSIYGKSKYCGEQMVRNFARRYFIIRTAWLYGDGDNFVRTMLRLPKTNPLIRVVGDQIGNPTYTKDLAKAIIDLSETEYYGTYHGTCQGSCSWYEFAEKIFEIMKIDVRVEKVDSSEFPRPAKRPKFSMLDNFMLRLQGMDSFRDWEVALRDYLQEDRKWQSLHL